MRRKRRYGRRNCGCKHKHRRNSLRSDLRAYHSHTEGPSCRLCGGQTTVLGVLGNLKHLRCRDCGAQYSKTVRRRRKK